MPPSDRHGPSSHVRIVAVVQEDGTPHRATLLSVDSLAALVEDLARQWGPGPARPVPPNDDDDDEEVSDLHIIGIGQLERLIGAVRQLRVEPLSGRLVFRASTSPPPPGERLKVVVRRAVDMRRDCPAAAAA
jgi:hypothetical protein